MQEANFIFTPHLLELVDYIDNYVPAFKVGSGGITWMGLIKIAKK